MNLPDCTLTTACFDLNKYNNHSRDVESAIKNMTSLLETPCYLVIYTDNYLLNKIKFIRDKLKFDSFTKYIILDVESLDSFKYTDIVKNNRDIYHPTKDERTCPESHLVCCSKFELVLKTININPFNTTKFGWIDSNVGENFSKICTNYKNNMLLNVLDKCSNNKFHLQILNVSDKKYIEEKNLCEYYSHYRWVVCGCLFITGKDIGIKILEDLKHIFIKHTLLGYGHGEEMFYLEILDKYYNDIERSYGDYNHILNNFINITTGLEYIYKFMVQNYMAMGYNKECIDCCEKVLTQFNNYNLEIDYSLYFIFMFSKYVSLFYIDKIKAKNLVNEIYDVISKNEFIFNEYIKNKDFYDTQFSYVL
jgi:hypothetical protein